MRFPISGKLDIIAPGLIEETWNEATVMGSVAWLWMHSQSHRNMPLHGLNVLLMPAIRQRQFLLAVEAGRPVGYVSWTGLSAEAEARYLRNSPLEMPEKDWNSGERFWFLDWVAPFGHTPMLYRLLRRQLLSNRCGRALYHRGNERGLRIEEFRGSAVPPAEARAWFASHPLATEHTTSISREGIAIQGGVA